MWSLSKGCLGGFGIVKSRPFFLLTAAYMSYLSLFSVFKFLLIAYHLRLMKLYSSEPYKLSLEIPLLIFRINALLRLILLVGHGGD